MAGLIRIGEVSRRTGVAPEVLRAWESRYGLLRPERSAGGFRLYGEDDVRRVESMQRLLAEGLSAAQAAREATAPAAEAAAPPARLRELMDAVEALDEAAAHAALDAAIAELSVDALLLDVVLPLLAELGARWEQGEVSVAQEHFATAVIRGRLLGLARGWGRGGAPHVLLACSPDEQHDLPLVCLGLALRARGGRVTYLGARTPYESALDAVVRLGPDLCVISATAVRAPARAERALREIAGRARLVFAGPAVDAAVARRLGAEVFDASPVELAASLG